MTEYSLVFSLFYKKIYKIKPRKKEINTKENLLITQKKKINQWWKHKNLKKNENFWYEKKRKNVIKQNKKLNVALKFESFNYNK